MAQYISKDALVAEIEKKIKQYEKAFDSPSFASYEASLIAKGKYRKLLDILQFIDTLEVKEVDFDALGVLAEHLIACDAHLVTPKYTVKELDLLGEWAKNNKTQKGE